MTRFFRRPQIKAWLVSAIMLSAAAPFAWCQDPDPFNNPDPFDTGLNDFTPLPPAMGQDDQPDPFANPEESSSILDSASGLPALKARPGTPVEQTAIERQRSFLDASDSADASIKLARDSFERGLMSLSDYADQTQAALEIRLSIAGLQQDRHAQVSALSAHADLMRNAAKQLREFEQPAATGWEADAAYAELLVANADVRLAAVRGDRGAYANAVERSQQLAETHYDLRATDFDQGLASLSSLSRAASYLATNVGLSANDRTNLAPEPSKFGAYLDKLAEIVDQTKEFSDLGAGVGRVDRVHQAEFELAKAAGQVALQKKDQSTAVASFNAAIDASQELFASQKEFHESGTASLRDVTDAWWSRVELADLSQRAGLKLDAASAAQAESDLGDLKRIVVATEDRQGRIAADVAYSKSLENLQGLWAREQAVAALARSRGASGGKLVKPARVLELNKNVAPAPAPEGTAPVPTKPQVEGTTPVVVDKSPQSTIEIVRPRRASKKLP